MDVRPEFAPGERVDPRGGLVEEKHGRPVHQGAGQGQTLLETERQFVGRAFEITLELEGFDHLGDAATFELAAQAINPGRKFEVLAHGKQPVKRKLLRHITELQLGLAGSRAQVEPGHPGFSRGGTQESTKHLEGGRFAGSVGTEKAEDLPLAHLEADVVGGTEGAEFFGQMATFDRLFGTKRDRLHTFGQRGKAALAAAEQVDEGVFESGADRLDAGAGFGGQFFELSPMGAAALFFRAQHHPHRMPLNDPVTNGRQREGRRQKLAAIARRAGELEAATPQALGQLGGISVENETPFVQQQNRLATFGLVEVGRGPDHRHAFPGQLRHHAPQILPR